MNAYLLEAALPDVNLYGRGGETESFRFALQRWPALGAIVLHNFIIRLYYSHI